MPVRNDAAMLRNCLTDIENQSFTNYELVVVDDGSTDETPVSYKHLRDHETQEDIVCRLLF